MGYLIVYIRIIIYYCTGSGESPRRGTQCSEIFARYNSQQQRQQNNNAIIIIIRTAHIVISNKHRILKAPMVSRGTEKGVRSYYSHTHISYNIGAIIQ